MIDVFQRTATLETETCCNCGILFAMPAEIRQRRLREGGDFYCPNGHGQHYTKTTEQQLREQLMREKSQREQAQAEANDLRDKNLKMNGKLSRVYKRVKNGVCPCCNRHFVNLENHMKTKHQDRRTGKQGRPI